MENKFFYKVIALVGFLTLTSSPVIAGAGPITSNDYESGMNESGVADATKNFFGWKQLKPVTSTVNLSFSAEAKQNLVIGLRYLDVNAQASWVEIVVGASGNKESRIKVCSASDPRPANSLPADGGTGIIPATDKPVSYTLSTTPDGTLTIKAGTETVLSMTKPWLKNTYNAYSFKTSGAEAVVVAGDMAGVL